MCGCYVRYQENINRHILLKKNKPFMKTLCNLLPLVKKPMDKIAYMEERLSSGPQKAILSYVRHHFGSRSNPHNYSINKEQDCMKLINGCQVFRRLRDMYHNDFGVDTINSLVEKMNLEGTFRMYSKRIYKEWSTADKQIRNIV